MRKIFCLLLVMVMCFSLALTGCKKPAETEPAATTAATVASTTATAAPTDATEETPTEDETPTEESKASTKSTVAMPSRPAAPTKATKATATKPAATTKATTTKATAAPTEAPTQAPTTQPTAAPTKAPTTPSTAAPTTRPTRPPVAPDAWKEDNSLKILAVGNSFSIDAMQYVYDIAKAAGAENVKLGNLYIAGCALDTHLDNAKNDAMAYLYLTNDSGKWSAGQPAHQISAAVQSENWDFVLFQQASPASGIANTYDDLEALIEIVEPLCTNKNVQFAWHMTWAYKTGSTNGAFKNYANDQNVMYSAITNVVKLKIVTNPDITKIIPNGTVIQNARTSYVGDNFTRDNSDHLSYEQGRKIAGLGVVASLIDIDWDTIDLSSVISDEAFRQVAIESVQNAVKNPYTVTQSTHK